jgi:hypothetical protein
MTYPIRIGRRHFLAGAGGFTLAIPFLSSLESSAVAATATAKSRYFYLGTDHGGAWDANFFPTAPASGSATYTSGHSIGSAPLTANVAGGTATLSPILSASSSALTSGLVAKMNLLRGLDVPWYIAHNTGQHLGNFARNDNNGKEGAAVSALGNRPTIDQLMANSQSFYAASDLAFTKQRAMVVNSGRALSWGFSDPSKGVASPVQNIQGVNSSLQLFKSIFGGGVTAPKTRPPVVDKILASYNSLRQGNSRLSAADKLRLDAHIATLSELQASLTARVACTTPATPVDDSQKHVNRETAAESAAWGRLFADVIAAAFACNASRIGVLGWGETTGFTEYNGSDWHHDVAHLWDEDQPQKYLVQSYQAVFEQVFVYLAAKLDALDDGGGKTVLDNTLLVWSQESGMETHASYSVPVVTFGSAGGYLKTGLYCDYRRSASKPIKPGFGASPSASVSSFVTYPGVLYQQWLATQLLAFGVAPSEFELWQDASGNVEHGYGTPYLSSYVDHYQSTSSVYFQNASQPLPLITG